MMLNIILLTLLILVEDDVAIVFHISATCERSPQSMGDGSIVLQIVRTQNLLDVNGGFLCMVERHLGEDVVTDVSVCDVVESVIQDSTERAINSAQCATQPVPFRTTEMRHKYISMLQVSDQNQVIVNNQVWNEVELSHIHES